uniref:Carboxypeptidase n=1 Tax=Callorhinchus milii TaxID=7868 RepID=A0A4W3GRH9_CALMI|eukprot:gi/632985677/ref/XP_007909818.1/ PREDICTED: retinoid-inducible serine carboxypeptidase [Callorhinchus milii]
MGNLEIHLVFLCCFALTTGTTDTQNGQEAWGYVAVRNDASMFWWLYYANSPTHSYSELPLVMWLQGGPGASGTGYGNFEEIGPLDKNLNRRKYSWVEAASLLFVDNPVGTGYSYTTNANAFAKDLNMVVSDMMILLKEFFLKKPEFQNIPFYIFSESYGGKMAAGIALALVQAVQRNEIHCRFAGVSLGDSWISPLDSVLSWGPYLYSMSLLDDRGLEEVNSYADQVQKAIEAGNYKQATDLWGATEFAILRNTDGVNFYNIMTKEPADAVVEMAVPMKNHYLVNLYSNHVRRLQKTSLDVLMNGPIRDKLKIIPSFVRWGGQSNAVFNNMEEDFMKPVIDIVDKLLAANVNVSVFNGQLDLIVDTVGQEAWVKKLKWPGLSSFLSGHWKPLYIPSKPDEAAAFFKQQNNFSFYWVIKAGHMVPSDQGEMALKMLRMITRQE